MDFIYADIYSDLIYAIEKIYKPNGFTIDNFINEPESQKYGACRFTLNGLNIQFRAACMTPKKTGQFVTLWKRNSTGTIEPFDFSDAVDFFIISVREKHSLGQFIFSKTILLQKNILSQEGKGGKRAMRVYCPWDNTESVQAKKTQAWQREYFLDISQPQKILDRKFQFK